MTSAKKGNKRVTGKEQFYTPPSVARQLLDDLIKAVPDLANEDEVLWYEPAGGTGNFINAVLERGKTHIMSVDLWPKHDLVVYGDFLEQDLSVHDKSKYWQHCIVYGNPPFGRNNSLSVKFFNHAASFDNVDVIAFVVPRSWRKWSVQDRLALNFELIYDKDLDMHYVTEDNSEMGGSGLQTCFQIWRRSTSLRTKVEVEDRGYITKVGPEEADVSLTVFGRGCGRVRTDFPRRPNSTQMFLKVTGPEVTKALSEIDFSEFYERTAYIEALSILEIRYCLNRYFDDRAVQ